MTIFFTSDHHFGHAKIIDYCSRPFSDVEEMDAELIRRWNEVVTPEDKVYHLGDFTLGNKEQARHYFAQLNGNICVLANTWHHDRHWLPAFGADKTIKSNASELNYVNILPPMVVCHFSQIFVLCHYPLAVWDRKHYGSLHLYGHSHGMHPGEPCSLDVGVDCHSFHPFSLEEVMEQMRNQNAH